MQKPKDIQSADFVQLNTEANDLFNETIHDYRAMALTLIEFNKAIYSIANDLRESLLTYSLLSTKKQNKG